MKQTEEMMRNLIAVLLVSVILWCSGCSPYPRGSGLNGTWRGTVNENRKSTSVGLQLREQGGTVTGVFAILSETGSNDVAKGRRIPIVQAERTGNNLKFIVPINGDVDDDAICFELVIDGNKLLGFGHELRAGSDKLPITFTR